MMENKRIWLEGVRVKVEVFPATEEFNSNDHYLIATNVPTGMTSVKLKQELVSREAAVTHVTRLKQNKFNKDNVSRRDRE
jgi:hypothetical protein